MPKARQQQKTTKKKIHFPERSYEEPKLLSITAYAFFLVLVFLTGIAKISGDDDFFWHLAIGKWIVEHREIPTIDLFSSGVPHQPWSPFEWLWDVITFLIYSYSNSYTIIQLLPAIAAVVIFIFPIYAMRRLGVSTLTILIVCLISLGVILPRLTPRPHIVTMVGLSIVISLYLIFRHSAHSPIKYLSIFPPLFLLWVNLHPGVVAGLILLGTIATAESFLLLLRNKIQTKSLHPLEKKNFYVVILVFAISILCTFANPQGPLLYIDIYHHTQLQMLTVIKEWKPSFSFEYFSVDLLMYKIFLALGVFTLLYAWKKKDILLALIQLIFTVYSLRAIRFVTDFAVSTMIGTSIGLQHFLFSSFPLVKKLFEQKVSLVILIILIVMAITTLPNGTFYQKVYPYPKQFGFGLDSSYLPLKMIEYLIRNNIKGNVFNDLEVGGLLLWFLPEQKNFIDSRNISDEIGKEYYRVLTKQPGFEKTLDNIDYIIFRPVDVLHNPSVMHHSLISYCSTHRDTWKLVYWDDLTLVYVKNLPKFKHVIEADEYRILHPYLLAFQTSLVDSLRLQYPDSYKKELKRKLSEDPRGVITSLFVEYERIRRHTK